MSSRFVQVTVVPTGTVMVAGPKLKLSIFTSAAAGADFCGFAATRSDPANSRIAIVTDAAKLTTSPVFFITFLVLSRFSHSGSYRAVHSTVHASIELTSAGA